MKRPKVLVIEKDEVIRKKIRDSLTYHPLNFRVDFLNNIEHIEDYIFRDLENSSNPDKTQLVYIRYSKDIPQELIEKLANQYSLPIVMLARPHELPDSTTIEKLPVNWMTNPINEKYIFEKIERLRQQGTFFEPINLAIIGSGRLAKSLFIQALSSPEIDKIHLWSTRLSLKEDYSEITDLLPIPEEEKESRIRCYRKLEEILSQDEIDLLVITTGKRYSSEEELPPTRQMAFYDNYPFVIPILSSLGEINPSYLIAIESNLPGPFIRLAVEKYGLNPRKLTSFSADTIRQKRVILSELKKHLELRKAHLSIGDKDYEEKIEEIERKLGFLKSLDLKNITHYVIGEHGEERGLFDNTKIGEYDFRYFDEHLMHPDSDFLIEILEKCRPIGTQAYHASIACGIIHPDVVDSIIRGIKEISHYQEFPQDSWYCWINIEDNKRLLSGALLWPVNILYRTNPNKRDKLDLEVFPNESFLPIQNLEKILVTIDPLTNIKRCGKDIIIEQILSQEDMTQKYKGNRLLFSDFYSLFEVFPPSKYNQFKTIQ